MSIVLRCRCTKLPFTSSCLFVLVVLAVHVRLKELRSCSLLGCQEVRVLALVLRRSWLDPSKGATHVFILNSSCFVAGVLPLVKDAVIAPELFETHFGHCYILESPDEEHVLIALEEEPEDHHYHATLSLHLFSNNLLLFIIEILHWYLAHNVVVCIQLI